MVVFTFYILQIPEFSWTMYDRSWHNKNNSNYGVNTKQVWWRIVSVCWSIWNTTSMKTIWHQDLRPMIIMTTMTTSRTPWSSWTSFGQSIKHYWPSFENTDLTITDQTIFTGFQHHYTTGYGFNSITPRWILGNCYHEPAAYHRDTDGEPTQEQLYLMITRCGKEAFTHNSTQLPTVSPNSKRK